MKDVGSDEYVVVGESHSTESTAGAGAKGPVVAGGAEIGERACRNPWMPASSGNQSRGKAAFVGADVVDDP
jgi:hypothetical protein